MSLVVSSEEAPRLLSSQPADSLPCGGQGQGRCQSLQGSSLNSAGSLCGKVLMPACAREEPICRSSDCRGRGGD